MKLHIYENKKIVKTYEAETYDLMWGTVEDVAAAINIDTLKDANNFEILKLVTKLVTTNMNVFKKLLKDIFDGLTDDELRNTKVKEIAQVMVDVVIYTVGQLTQGSNEKN